MDDLTTGTQFTAEQNALIQVLVQRITVQSFNDGIRTAADLIRATPDILTRDQIADLLTTAADARS